MITYRLRMRSIETGFNYYGPPCTSRACAIESVSPLEGDEVIGIETVEHIEPVSGLRFRLDNVEVKS